MDGVSSGGLGFDPTRPVSPQGEGETKGASNSPAFDKTVGASRTKISPPPLISSSTMPPIAADERVMN